MKIYISHSSSFDYLTELYEPLKRSLAQKHEIFFPHNIENVSTKSKNVIAESDCVLAEVSYPSTGQGIELGWAEVNKVPILCFYRKGANISNSLKFVSGDFTEYETVDEIAIKLETLLNEL